jgi:hypothetical protein
MVSSPIAQIHSFAGSVMISMSEYPRIGEEDAMFLWETDPARTSVRSSGMRRALSFLATETAHLGMVDAKDLSFAGECRQLVHGSAAAADVQGSVFRLHTVTWDKPSRSASNAANSCSPQ